MAILVTGGAGYIGSHMAHALVERGEEVVVLDNLATGADWLVPHAASFIRGDISDQALVGALIRDRAVTEIIHFAGSVTDSPTSRNAAKCITANTPCSRIAARTAATSAMSPWTKGP